MRALAFLVCGVAFGQVEAPTIGSMVDSAGQLRKVFGVAGNFVLGEADGAGELVASLPSVVASDEELIVKRKDASEARFALRNVSGMRAMSEDWVQVVAEGRSYALRVEPGREALFVLPEPKVETRRR